jgi:hypothetical protein
MCCGCFIYGSVHVKMPRRDVVERVLGTVDYVLLEGLGVRSWRELVKRDWRTIIVVIILLIYFKALRLSVRIMNLHYRLRYGIDFKGDMEYVAELANNRHIKIETVDEDLVSIYEKDREAFTGILWRNPFWTFSIIGAVILILLKHVLWFIPPTSLVFIILKYILLPLSVAFIIMPILAIPELFRRKTMTIRDAKLIDRVQELINQGHKVLIVRGEEHVNYIVGELRKRGIECEELNKASPHRPSTTTERFEAFTQHIAQSHPNPGPMGILRSHPGLKREVLVCLDPAYL